MKISIAVLSHGPGSYVEGFFRSLVSNQDEIAAYELRPFCVESGNSNVEELRRHEDAAKKYRFEYINNWGTNDFSSTLKIAIEKAYNDEAEFVGIFRDDAAFHAPGWINRGVIFLQQNPEAGIAHYFPVQSPGFRDTDAHWMGQPLLVEAKYSAALLGRPIALLDDGADMQKFLLPWPPIGLRSGKPFPTLKPVEHSTLRVRWLNRIGELQEEDIENISKNIPPNS